MSASPLHLKIQQIQQVSCLWELSWGKGQQISATLPYPETVLSVYRDWQQVYLNFYQTAFRARKAESGTMKTSPEDWHRQLVEQEAKLIYELRQWLQLQELYELRREIARKASQITDKNHYLDLFLTCNCLELERLPWEAWELGSDLGVRNNLRIIRTPFNLTQERQTQVHRFQRSRVRILAILGDETGLNFSTDKEVLNSLQQQAEIQFVSWQTGQTSEAIKRHIQQVLTEQKGWDMLFFAGHSGETSLTGGQIAIAPNVSISVKEIAGELKLAQSRGLQFALFNSCSGLSIAKSLIDLGFAQVLVMREPIHNQVAQIFLAQFIPALARYQDVYSALINAVKYLQEQENLHYPSGYLIPSLFAHPSASLFRIEPVGWKQIIHKWLPQPMEAVTVGIIGILSLMPSVTNFLLEGRILAQSIYRDITGQIPSATIPPVLLVQIDEESIKRAEMTDPHPIDRRYIASIINQLTTLEAQIIGIDYLFDRPSPEQDPILAQSVNTAIQEKGSWFIFASIIDVNDNQVGVELSTGIMEASSSLQGYTNALPNYVKIPKTECEQICPFAYLLATVWAVHQQNSFPQSQFNHAENLQTQLFDFIAENYSANNYLSFFQNLHSHPLTLISQLFGQNWLRPIVDYSLPPDLVYNYIPAWKLLNNLELNNYQFNNHIVIIAPGGYDEAGITLGEDNFSLPLAMTYWRERIGWQNISSGKFTGSEAHSYMIDHLLNQRLVIPLPDLWAILLAAFLGKGVILFLDKLAHSPKQIHFCLSGATTVYGLVSLQLYVTSEVLLPWLLPSLTLVIYLWFFSRNKYDE
jgi:hypothetical protein